VLTRQGIRLSDARSTLLGGRTTQANAALAESEHAFCRHCNGWRGSLGLEPTPSAYIEHMVTVFREVRRVLRKDGTLWMNIGDSYASGTKGDKRTDAQERVRDPNGFHSGSGARWATGQTWKIEHNCKPKDLLGIPWALAFALRDDGWYLRSEITWAKRAPMPESVSDRPTSATEKVFLLAKNARYFYDAEAVKEDLSAETIERWQEAKPRFDGHDDYFAERDGDRKHIGQLGKTGMPPGGNRNMRNWWLLGPEPFPEAHFAVFPTEIPRRAILAGTSERGVCPKCGAPWERIVNKYLVPDGNRKAYAGRKGAASDGRDHGSNVYRDGHLPGNNETETIGWRPTCSCDPVAPVPGTVLDPFLGAGTTALVADQLQRDAVGIELSHTYAAMARKRIEEDAPLLAQIAAD
jgi:DNA modification methylase